MSLNNWNKHDRNWNRNKKFQRSQIPPNLKGRDIGLYFKNLHSQRKQEMSKDMVISLKIPNPVILSVRNNLQQILFLAKKQDIELPEIVTSSYPKLLIEEVPVKNKDSAQNLENFNENNMEEINKPEENIENMDTQSIKNEPSTSTPHMNSIKSEKPIHFINNIQQFNQNSSSYKYAYDDIITGTFDEKLVKCLSKGVSINYKDKNISDLSFRFQIEYKDMTTRSNYKKFLKFREILPTYKKSEDILNLVKNNQVIVVSGETGSGKSTQIPQIILDDAIKNNRGANTKIMVTQPRRIAASSLAARVAQERCEKIGNSVGYAVRLERKEERPRASIQYCTTGVLLVELEMSQGLTDFSHIILDEVHERDSHVDLAMCMLKQILKRRQDLKLILMSATLDAESLSVYFDNAPVMKIEGIAYPVKDVYLEEILRITQFKLPSVQKPKNRPKWHKFVKNLNKPNDMEKDIKYKAEIAPWLESQKYKLDHDVYKTLQDVRIEELNLQLLLELLKYICRGDPGAVLIFLPGISEISRFMRMMNESNFFPSDRFEIYPLHSKLPSLEQHKIFEKPPNNIRKIIIATNIAETSITIDDIIYVIDSGKIKLNGFNVKENIATLKTEWVAQANLRQRRGRAGRCQPGICYHLLTTYRASKLQERLLPELQRSNLLEAVLSVKRLRLGLAAHAFSILPSPPHPSTVEWAVKHLQQCGALDGNETLTPLGWHLARLPVHPAAGKLLLLASLFGCLDRAASLAAVWSFKDPFQLVIGKEMEVEQAKRSLTLGEPSDHIAVSEAILQWEQCGSWQRRRSFAHYHFLSHNTLELLADMKRQLGYNLKQMGFLPSGDVKSPWENRNASNLSLFKAIVAAALYPNIASVRWLNLNARNRPIRIQAFTPEEGKTSVHPSSVMAPPKNPKAYCGRPVCNSPGANWLVYWLKQHSSELFLLDVTLIYTLPLLFFGEFIFSEVEEKNSDECYLSIKTVKVKCKKESADLLCKLRSLLDLVLANKVTTSDHTNTHTLFEEEVITAVINLITAEDERAVYMGDDVSESDSDDEPIK
ncbi:ATP-dependent DNA/RNA helicase DHX36-like [Battus philenor]|uniref:ATP-dependent DNA/RNA helicase DHX36-like n=1 Tax=Battus philenor TaxID=42288 RepID=UPI0035CED116